MRLTAYKTEEYDHRACGILFDTLNKTLGGAMERAACDGILAGNYRTGGAETDALLITGCSLTVFFFAGGEGEIRVSDSHVTTAKGMVLTSYTGMPLNPGHTSVCRKRIAEAMPRSMGIAPGDVSVCVVFSGPVSADISGLSPETGKWFAVCGTQELASYADSIAASCMASHRKLPAHIVSQLRLDRAAPVCNCGSGDHTAGDLFGELWHSAGEADSDIRKAYSSLGRALRHAADQKLAGCRTHFAGLFPKISYLIKEYGISTPLSLDINDTRGRLRNADSADEARLRQLYAYDLRTVCRFVSAVYGNTEIPARLTAMFPSAGRVNARRTSGGTDCLRVTVDSWDERHIHATGEDGLPVVVSCTADWDYLPPLLSPGTRLNIIRPREENGVMYPELTVFEPDYLTDISAVAACFESYADSPLAHLLNKLRPAAPSEPILLGNFAGQLLDEAVHEGTRPYADSVRDFFRKNALGIAFCPPLSGNFHPTAQQQLRNIRCAVDTTLPAEVDGFSRRKAMVEPSFFCEMLGLQGRMDLLQADCGVLVEQKSGKGAFPPLPDPDTPRHQRRHYVQLMLYMALLHYNYNKKNSDIAAFLLYSRYKNSLVRLGPAPALLREAMRIRNRMVWCEMYYARGGTRILETLTPERLNEKGLSGRLWEHYVRPQIESLLRPVHEASQSERDYYFRFLTFLETEHLLAKLGSRTKENSGFASTWHDTLDEKRQAGSIFCGLTLDDPARDGVPAGGITRLRLAFSGGTDTESSNFRTGDIVILYSYPDAHEPDACRTMVFRCVIVSMSPQGIVLQLRFPQTDAGVFARKPGHRWAVEHDLIEASFSPLYKGMHAFLSAPQRRRDLLLTKRKPETDKSIRLAGEYGKFNTLVLRARQARDFFLVIGPPGTGKTSFGLLNILREELLDTSSSVLLLSYTNRAVDEICGKLAENGISFVRMGSPFTCAEEFRPYLLENKAGECAGVADVKRLVSSARVVCSTTSSLNSNTALLSMRRFSLAIVDEASQILEPHITGLLSAQCGDRESIERFVLIGDHKQLPAVVMQTAAESRVTEPSLLAAGLSDCRDSLFERLLRTYRDNPEVVYMLTRQGRMHSEIASFPSKAFYGGMLRTVPLEHQERALRCPACRPDTAAGLILTSHRVAFVASPDTDDDTPDKVNTAEAAMIAEFVTAAYRLRRQDFNPDRTVGVIVPYRNQITAVREAIARSGIPVLERVTTDTVERYQGSQRDIIIYGFTARKRYQLGFLTSSVFEENGVPVDRRLNVAMTRARENLVMIGNPGVISADPVFARLIEHVRSEGGYYGKL